jgi:hypothetical protein
MRTATVMLRLRECAANHMDGELPEVVRRWRFPMIELPAVLLSAALSIALSPDPATPNANRTAPILSLLTAADRRVRTIDRRLTDLLARGVRRSATFADLVAKLNTTDVIVYIEPVDQLPSTVAGRLMLIPIAHNQRYLRIQVRVSVGPDELIALIGHELQHALEIAASPDVRDERALIALYQRIGQTRTGLHSYDTLAAQDTGYRVKAELIQSTVG